MLNKSSILRKTKTPSLSPPSISKKYTRPHQETPFNSSARIEKPRFFPFFSDIIIDSLRRTPSPQATFYRTVNSIIQEPAEKSRMLLSKRKRECVGELKPKLCFYKLNHKRNLKSPIRVLTTAYKPFLRIAGKSESPYSNRSKKYFEVGCQIDIE